MQDQFTTEILSQLPTIVENGPGQTSYQILEKIGLDEDEIDDVFDIINQGVGRASLYRSGMTPDQFESYLDENIIFQKTIAIVNNNEVEAPIDTTGLHPELKKAFSNSSKEENIDVEKIASDFMISTTPDRDNLLYSLLENNYSEITPLIEKALFDTERMVQIVAIQGITKENIREETIPLLIQLFKQTNDNTLIGNLTSVFSTLNVTEALPAVEQKLKEEHLMTLYDCIICLGTLGDTSTIEKLVPFKSIDKVAQTFDDNGILRSETGFTISEITEKAIAKIKKTYSL